MFDIKVLSMEDVKQVAEMGAVIKGVEEVYKAKSAGETDVWPTVFHEFDPGHADMDIKSGKLTKLGLFGHKTVSWFGANAEKGLPTLVGVIVIYDMETGAPLAVLDGSYITGLRTGAAGAIGAKYLARKDSENLFVLGAGNQAAFQIAAMLTLFPGLKKVQVCDALYPENAVRFAEAMPGRLRADFGIEPGDTVISAVTDMAKAVGESDIVVTVTPSREPVIKKEWVSPGTHFSCIGADMAGKEEIEAEIMRNAVIYVDDMVHCMEAGEVEIPLKSGVIKPENILGEIGDLILGKTPGRTSDDQITVYDATGMALLDIMTGKTLLDLAKEKGLGTDASL